MGRRGPAPTPTRLKILRGNPGHRSLNPDEPRPAVKTPPCPTWLSPEARAVWRRQAKRLYELGVLTESDGDALATYCSAFARWQAAESVLHREGNTCEMETRDGRVVTRLRPEVGICRELYQIIRQYQMQFGLTPSSRSQIRADPPKTGKTALDKLAAGR